MFTRATEPQTIGEVLDSGFKLFAASLKYVFIPAFLGSLASSLGNIYLVFEGTGSAAAPDLQRLGPLFWIMMIVGLVVSIAIYAGIIHRVDAVGSGYQSSFGKDLAVGFRAAPKLILAGVLFALAIAVGLLLLIIPAVILSVSLMFYAYALVLDGKGPLDCLNYSHRLVWGDWWRTAALLTVAFIVIVIFYVLLGIAIGFMMAVDPSQDATQSIDLISLIATPLLGAIVNPFFVSLLWAIYRDLQLRKEGADLEARIGDMEGA